ncbi:MAG: dTDP-glucose 4,6-dehydratase [Dehalococcoidia bacterium]|nr:MAG: dTDP-glucose 4,6-dehydratase [Dehalococcoidia bacterium]
MKLLVTGGAGFIGSNFIHYILREHSDYEVINLDALTYAGSLENLEGVMDNPQHRFVQGRIEDGKLVGELMEGVVIVIYFAAESHVDRSIVEPQVFIVTNVLGTQVLLDAALKYEIKLFFQISTDEVYGALDLDSNQRFTEESPLRPNSPYAASKTSADLLVRAYHRTFGLPILISRCSNNYGPRQHPEKFLPTVILSALQDRPVPIYGDGLYVRDWIHVLDHCMAIDTVVSKGKIGEIYNIGTNNEWPNIELAKKVLQILGKSEDLLQSVTDRPGHDRRYALDGDKMKRELGWQPSISFDEGLSETIRWYAENGK